MSAPAHPARTTAQAGLDGDRLQIRRHLDTHRRTRLRAERVIRPVLILLHARNRDGRVLRLDRVGHLRQLRTRHRRMSVPAAPAEVLLAGGAALAARRGAGGRGRRRRIGGGIRRRGIRDGAAAGQQEPSSADGDGGQIGPLGCHGDALLVIECGRPGAPT